MEGGDRLEFDIVTETQYAVLVTTKMLFNSIVSTPGGRFCTFYIKDLCYGSPMSDCEFMWIHLVSIPHKIIDQYDLDTI